MMGSYVRMLFLNVGWFQFPCEEEQAVGRKAQCVEKVQAGNTAATRLLEAWFPCAAA